MTRFALIANPENRRATCFQEALAARGLPPARVTPWRALLAGETPAADAVAGVDAVRIESPGEDFSVERLLIARGAGEPDDLLAEGDRLPADRALALVDDRGRVRHTRQWFLGFRAVLRELDEALAASDAVPMQGPQAAITMFDKPACQARFAAAGLAVPQVLPGPLRSWEELRAAQAASGMRRVFVKPAHASSASGVIALATAGPGRLVGTTSVELVREGGELKLYNSLKLRRYTDERDLAAIVDALAPDVIHVEEWVPKAKLEGEALDLRVVVVDGVAGHAVVRQSKSPLTNLHLGNRRGDLGALQAMLGPARWAAVEGLARAATAAIPGALYAGVDLVVARGLKRQVVIEANAFGDLLPRIVDAQGRSTYLAELDAISTRLAGGGADPGPITDTERR